MWLECSSKIKCSPDVNRLWVESLAQRRRKRKGWGRDQERLVSASALRVFVKAAIFPVSQPEKMPIICSIPLFLGLILNLEDM